jgi:hypothetical protein
MTTAKKKKVISTPHGSHFKVTDTDRETITSLSAKLRAANMEIKTLKSALTDLEQRVSYLEP